MGKNEIILLVGIIIALIWLMACILIEGKGRKYIIIIGIVLAVVLFIVCRNWGMLLFGVIGGLLCGLVPGFAAAGGNMRMQSDERRQELGGSFHYFFVMIFMTMVIAYHLEVRIKNDEWNGGFVLRAWIE